VLRTLRNSVLASGAVALAAFVAFNPVSCAAEETAAPQSAATAPAAEETLPDMVLGKADAPVTIVEYSSLSCPHCATFHKEVLPKLKSEYIDTGKVRYVEREFPLNNAAFAGSVLARCVDPIRFYVFNDMLFSRQDEWAFKEDAIVPLRQYAKQAGLTDAEFDKCIDDEALQKKVVAVRNQGEKEGVKGTPTFFINGKVYKGAPTLEAMAEAIKPYLTTQ
jgi:protein-disulfide isomerase